jgi:hypothetical protein
VNLCVLVWTAHSESCRQSKAVFIYTATQLPHCTALLTVCESDNHVDCYVLNPLAQILLHRALKDVRLAAGCFTQTASCSQFVKTTTMLTAMC